VTKTQIKFGTSGWRGVIADTFTFSGVRRAAAAIAGHAKALKPNPTIVVGNDTRFFSPEFARSAASVLRANGCTIKFCPEPTPTPVIAHAIIFNKFDNFEERIKTIFGIPGEEQVASQRIHQVKQTGSAAQYYAMFQRLANKLDWEPNAFASAYYMGLKDSVKDRMGAERPVDYKPLIEKSIEIDNWLYERQMERKGSFRGYGGTYRNKQSSYGDPMDLSVMQDNRASRSKGFRRNTRGPRGNDKERDRRRQENLCYTCGKPGHRARDCKTTAQGLHMMSDGIAGMEEQKADTSIRIQVATDSQDQTA